MASEPQDLNAFLGTKRRPWWRRNLRWIVIALVVVVLGLLVSRCFAPKPPPSYITMPAEKGALAVTVSATGRLAPIRQVTVGSEISGLVLKVLVDVNDQVTEGQPIAIIDPARLDDAITQSRATLAANQAAVAQTRATLDEATAQLRRMEEVSRLSGGKVPAQTELDTARAAVARARANLRSAEANVVSAQASLSSNQTQRTRSIIRSPVNGVVLARQVDAGQTVAASFNTPTMFVIAQDLTHMKLEVAIDEADVGAVKVGLPASFTVDAFPGRTFPAQITRVDLGSNLTASTASTSASTTTTTANQVVSYAAILSVANPDMTLRPGMTATATIGVEKLDNALLIPNGALRFTPEASGAKPGASIQFGPRRQDQQKAIGRGSKQIVYIVGKDGKPEQVEVVTGPSDGSRTAVTSAKLKPGMKLIVGVQANGPAKPAKDDQD
ncbi:efflux RND transporter periplasmic adaptor subunit [Sphingomonas pokkalii]|uniref:Efflux RND transporter periplasmic adaptor subunit n=1 Tax=Sphingomonas pokkalii TaxID=2175090 RepID=A0A2U0SF28_9SPHN|nr:efflux RND transporter periplasmic adaptor subunit [Sphingomonas pokkalii]PVX29968.1 efflux RND transporter periplasmic adaptor subunit [Sphingomonas pokkalii]